MYKKEKKACYTTKIAYCATTAKKASTKKVATKKVVAKKVAAKKVVTNKCTTTTAYA